MVLALYCLLALVGGLIAGAGRNPVAAVFGLGLIGLAMYLSMT